MSHSEVVSKISSIEIEIQEWTRTTPVENWFEIITKLEKESLHPNHFLIFDLKKTIISQMDSSSKLDILEDKLILCQDVLNLVKKLDPGLTLQYAFLLKMSALTRAELVKTLKSTYPENEKVLKRCTELSQKAMAEFRMGASCLNPKKS